MTEAELKERCYEIYQLDWLIEHGYSLRDLFMVLREGHLDGIYSGEIKPNTFPDAVFDYIESYFTENGFKGEIFSSEEEFYDNEYQDKLYMTEILPANVLCQYLAYRRKE